MTSTIRATVLFAIAAGASGCVQAKIVYAPPAPVLSRPAPFVVALDRQEVWKALIPRLAQTFFVINNIDQSSGFVNVSYSGDPESYVDCGHITAKVQDGAGIRAYNFPGSRAHQWYEERFGQMSLPRFDGRVSDRPYAASCNCSSYAAGLM
jgi:hypothetical protein